MTVYVLVENLAWWEESTRQRVIAIYASPQQAKQRIVMLRKEAESTYSWDEPTFKIKPFEVEE